MRRILSIAGIVIVLAATSLITPRLMAIILQVQGGQSLERGINLDESILEDHVVCTYEPTTNQNAQDLVLQAIDKLQQSLEYNQRLSQSHLLLGRSYCFLGEPQKAVEAYEVYTNLRPSNPLGHLELGFALEALCQKEADQAIVENEQGTIRGVCSNQELRERIAEEWNNAGLVTGYFSHEADNAFSNEDMESTFRWFQRGAIFGGQSLSPGAAFKWFVASIATGRTVPDVEADIVEFYNLKDSLLLEAEELHWIVDTSSEGLDYGGQLKDYPMSDPNYGVMWWKGRALAFLNVEETAAYEISIRQSVRYEDPLQGQVEIQIEKDLSPVEVLNLTNQGSGFHEVKAATLFTAGNHLIDLNFLEDNGDIMIDWIKINKLPSN